METDYFKLKSFYSPANCKKKMKEYFLMLIYDVLCNISELFIVQ